MRSERAARRKQMHRARREARRENRAFTFDGRDVVVRLGWCQRASELDATRWRLRTELERLLGDRRAGAVHLRQWTGDQAKKNLELFRADASGPDADHFRRVAACLREYGGVLVVAFAEGRNQPKGAADALGDP